MAASLPVDLFQQKRRAGDEVPEFTTAGLRVLDARSHLGENVIHGVMRFREPPAVEVVRKSLRDATAVMPTRWRSLAIDVDGDAKNVVFRPLTPEQLNGMMELMVVEHDLPGAADEAALKEYVTSLMTQRLPDDRPLWQYIVIRNFRGAGAKGGRGAVIGRFAHALGDGPSLIEALFTILDASKGIAPTAAGTGGKAESTSDQASTPPAGSGTPGKRPSSKRHATARMSWQQPIVALRILVHRLWLLISGVILALVFIVIPSDNGPLKVDTFKLNKKRGIGHGQVDLSRIKALRVALGGTVNDVLVSVLGGALRRYVQKTSANPEAANAIIRGFAPMNVRPQGQSPLDTFGNHFALIPLTMPTTQSTPLQRFRAGKLVCDDLKVSPLAPMLTLINKVLSKLIPARIHATLMTLFFQRVTMLFTNVHGPDEHVVLGESDRVESMFFVVPAPVSVVLSALSYAGKVNLGVVADPAVMPDPQVFCDMWMQEVASLEAEAADRADELEKSHNTLIGTPGTGHGWFALVELVCVCVVVAGAFMWAQSLAASAGLGFLTA